MGSLLSTTRNNLIIVTPVNVGVRALGLVYTVVLTRYLTVSDFGIYTLLIGSLFFLRLPANLGMASSLQRFLPEYARSKRKDLFLNTFFLSCIYRSLVTIALCSLVIICFDFIFGLLNVSISRFTFILFAIGTFSLFHIELLQIAVNSLLLQKYSAVGDLAFIAMKILLTAIVLSTFSAQLSNVFASELVVYGIGAILFWLIFFRKGHISKGEKIRNRSKRVEWKRFWRYSLLSAATGPGKFLFSHAMDLFVVSVMATTSQLGIYALGSRASNMLISIMPQNLLQTVVRPTFYHRYYSDGDKNVELNRMFRSLVVMISGVLFPVLALVSLQAEPILTFVFKSKFAGATPVFMMLLAFNIFKVLELPSDLVLQAIEKVQARLYAQVFAVYNIIAAILLLPKFGLLGVAFATGSALMGKCLFWYFMARYYTGISISWSALFKILINTAVAGGVAFWMGHLGDSPVWMFVSLITGAFAYIAMSLVNHFFDDREKELVNRFCKRQIFKIDAPAEAQ